MKKALLLLLLALPLYASQQTDEVPLHITVYRRITLSWTASTTTGVTYSVYRGTVSGGPYSQVVAGITNLSWDDTTAAHGETYYYVATAVGTDGQESSYSNQASVTVN